MLQNETVAVDDTAERILVVGDDMRIFLSIVRSLGRAGKEVHAAPFDWHAPALKSRYVSAVHHLPRYSDDPVEWRNSLLEVLRKNSFNLIVPCCDRAILPLHAHRREFSEFPLAIPNPVSMKLLFDKAKTRKLCRQLGIPVVSGRHLKSNDQATGLVAEHGLPLVIKAASSYSMDRLDSAGKVWILDTQSELKALLVSLKNTSPYLVESYFEGVGTGVSVLAQDGKILHAFQHRRLREGRGGSSSYRVSEPVNKELRQACERICLHTKMTGVCMFEFRCNPESGKWVLLETNARFWGSSPLPLSLGVDFPRYLYDLMVLGIKHGQIEYPAGIRSRNFLLDGRNILSNACNSSRSELAGIMVDVADFVTQPVRWATGKERSDSIVVDDLMPALWEFATLFRTLSQRQTRNRNSQLLRRRGESAVITGIMSR